jgi:hypothetical protein
VFANGWADPGEIEDRVSLEALKAQCARAEAGPAYYEKLGEHGLYYGSSFQTVQELYINESFALAKLELAEQLKGEFAQYMLHPSLIDGALQTVAGLVGDRAGRVPYVPFALDELEIIRPVPQTCYAYAERADGYTPGHAGVTKFNIRLLNESGDVLIRLRNLYVRPLARPASHSLVAAGAAAEGRLLEPVRTIVERKTI